MKRHRGGAEFGLGLLAVAGINAAVWFLIASSRSEEARIVLMGATNEILGVLLIALPELSEVLKRATRYVTRWFKLAIVTFEAWRAFRRAGRIEDLAQRGEANAAISLALVVKLFQDSLREDDTRVVPAADRESLKKLAEYVAKLESQLKEESASIAERVFGRHLPLRLLGVSLVVAGLITSLVGHLQGIESKRDQVVVTTTEVVVTDGPDLSKGFMWFGQHWTTNDRAAFEWEAARHGIGQTRRARLYALHPRVRYVFGGS